LPDERDGIVCSDKAWDEYGEVLGERYYRVSTEQLGGQLAFVSGGDGSSAQKMVASVSGLMSTFITNPEAVRHVDECELPHAKLNGETCSRLYFPIAVQEVLSSTFDALGKISKKNLFLQEQTM